MNFRKWIPLACCGLVLVAAVGCARAARDTTGFAVENSITVEAPYMETWQAVKRVLGDQGYDIYTRDKRGTFVAFTRMERQWFQPKRVKYTVEVASLSDNETKVQVETIRQVFGVTLLTFPNWHDRETTEDAGAVEILEAVHARLTGEEEAAPAPEDTAQG